MGTYRSRIGYEKDDHMIPIQIPVQDLAALAEERYAHPHPRVQRKLHTLYLVGLGYPHQDAARMIGVSEGTVRNDIHAYEVGGMEALRQFNPILKRRPWATLKRDAAMSSSWWMRRIWFWALGWAPGGV